MENLKKIGWFFAIWISTVVGLFSAIFVVRLLFITKFNIVSAILDIDPGSAQSVFYIGLIVACCFLYKKKIL